MLQLHNPLLSWAHSSTYVILYGLHVTVSYFIVVHSIVSNCKFVELA